MKSLNPMIISLIGLVAVTGVMILVLAISKPKFVLRTTEKKRLNWGKTISISLVVGLLAAIVLYLTQMKPAMPVKQDRGAQMTFNRPAECY